MLSKSCGAVAPFETLVRLHWSADAGGSGGGEGPSPVSKFSEAATSRMGGDDKEEQLWVGGYSGKAMFGGWIMAAVATIGLIVATVFLPGYWLILVPLIAAAWIIMGLALAYKKLSIAYELTTQRFIHANGLLTRTTDRIEVIDIDDVTYTQGLIQRMLGVGTIKISSSDRSHPELVLNGIDEVDRVADLIDDTRRSERRRRGLHIEAI
jgi:membrane protein YdbS with pleckstrin-like domain